MTRNERYQFITEYFRARQPHVTTELEFSTPFQLLCATLLSAQCTDKRVNMVTPALFARYPSSKEMAQATPDDILELIHSVSYPNSKARHLVGMAQKLESEFGGEVPDDPKQLMTLPGVGRKTATSWRLCGSVRLSCLSTPMSIGCHTGSAWCRRPATRH